MPALLLGLSRDSIQLGFFLPLTIISLLNRPSFIEATIFDTPGYSLRSANSLFALLRTFLESACLALACLTIPGTHSSLTASTVGSGNRVPEYPEVGTPRCVCARLIIWELDGGLGGSRCMFESTNEFSNICGGEVISEVGGESSSKMLPKPNISVVSGRTDSSLLPESWRVSFSLYQEGASSLPQALS